VKNWELAFTGAWPALLVMGGAAAGVVVAYLFYLGKKGALPRFTFSLVSSLRTLAIIVIAVFLLQPVLRFTRVEASQAVVAVLLDVSESMSIRDAAGDRSRLEAARMVVLGEPAGLVHRIARTQGVRLFSFGALTAELRGQERAGELEPQDKATALGEALKTVVQEVGRENASALVVLTDGVSNLGEEPEAVARTLGVPVFPVALGGRLARRGLFHDVGIVSAPRSPRLIVNNKAKVKVEIAHIGLQDLADADRAVTLRLKEDDELLAEEPLRLAAEDEMLQRELEFVPRQVGIHKLEVSISTLRDETVTQNNTRSFTVRVTDPRIRVLIVEGVVRSEYRFLRRVLESDPNLEVTSVIKLSGERFLVQGVQAGADLSRGLPAQLEDYGLFDVVLLGDIGREEFTGLQLEQLKDFVYAGGGLFALGGYSAFGAGGYADSAVADVLPVTMSGESDGHAEAAFAPALTAEGRLHPVFEGCQQFFQEGGGRVSLEGANRVTGHKPAAHVLAVHPTEQAGGEPMPVVAAQAYGSGRVVALTADTTWKWKFQVEAQGMDSPYYRFWGQAIRWLADREVDDMAPDQLVSASAARIEYEPGEPVTLKARVRNRDKQPEDGAAVDVHVRYPIPVQRKGADGAETIEKETTVTLAPVPLSGGQYQLLWRPPASGLYQATARARLGEDELGADTFEFVVGRAASEFDRVDVAESTLQGLAAQTGGVYHTLATAARIPDELEERRRLVLHHEEASLWNVPWFFGAFLACVAAEWVLRKRRGLN